MSRLIDADALIHELNNSHYPGAPYVDAGISIAIGKVCDAPTIEERKKGKWERVDMYYEDAEQHFNYHEYFCSECGVKRKIGWGSVNFCPNCGADMRGEEHEHND